MTSIGKILFDEDDRVKCKDCKRLSVRIMRGRTAHKGCSVDHTIRYPDILRRCEDFEEEK